MLKHELDALVEAGEANVLIIDVDGKREQLADKGITGLPHIEFFQDGVFIGKQSGFSRRDELLSKFK